MMLRCMTVNKREAAGSPLQGFMALRQLQLHALLLCDVVHNHQHGRLARDGVLQQHHMAGWSMGAAHCAARDIDKGKLKGSRGRKQGQTKAN
jgi:hypothetical protein